MVYYKIYTISCIYPFRFLRDLALGDGLALIGQYIYSKKNQSKSLIIDLWL